MEHGKDPLVSPSADWVRDYHSEVDRRHRTSSASSSSSSTSVRRRHRRRITPQTKYARRRVVQIVVVTAGLLAIMTLFMFYALSRNDAPGGGEGSALARPTTSLGG